MEISENEGYWVKTLGMQGEMDGFMEEVAFEQNLKEEFANLFCPYNPWFLSAW